MPDQGAVRAARALGPKAATGSRSIDAWTFSGEHIEKSRMREIEDAVVKHQRSNSPLSIEAADREPWVVLDDGVVLADWSRRDEVAYNQTNRQQTKYRYFVQAFDFLKENGVAGDYFEFGCHRARTFRMALTEARRHHLGETKFFAFDSFQGLPEAADSHGVVHWNPGALATSVNDFMGLIRQHGIYVDSVIPVEGFYDESLNETLSRRLLGDGHRIALACVDCDLYESAETVFAFIEPFLQEGSLVYLDDYFAGYKGSPKKGVAKAFREFRARSRFEFVRHLDVGWWGRSYIAYSDDEN